MPQCRCTTKAGYRCTFGAAPGSQFCKRHALCDRVTTQEDNPIEEVHSVVEVMQASVRNIETITKALTIERDFYLQKLYDIEAALSNDTTSDKVKRILFRTEV